MMGINNSHKAWSKHAVIYELNIRQYSREGTIQAVMSHLRRLSDMGVGIIWLMPLYPVGKRNRKGTLGSYYSVKDCKAVDQDLGTLEDLKEFIQQAHHLGMKVILDWVANHTAWDHCWTREHPDYYVKDESGDFHSPYDWSDVIKLDYQNFMMRKAMIDALKFWVEEADVDGFRCDVAGLVPTDFWEDARRELDAVGKPLFMLAEDEENGELVRYAFDMNYDWKIHHLMTRIASGESNADDFYPIYDDNSNRWPRSVYRMNFLTNHDENSWNGSEFERLGAGVEAFAVMAWTIPGMPLMYSGQEAGLDRRLKFFDKDEINWETIRYHDFYKLLNKIKRDNRALWNGDEGAPLYHLQNSSSHQVLSFIRDLSGNTILVVLNLSPHHIGVNLELSEWEGDYIDLITEPFRYSLNSASAIQLAPWEYRILKRD